MVTQRRILFSSILRLRHRSLALPKKLRQRTATSTGVGTQLTPRHFCFPLCPPPMLGPTITQFWTLATGTLHVLIFFKFFKFFVS
eukprot:s2553_g11.t1